MLNSSKCCDTISPISEPNRVFLNEGTKTRFFDEDMTWHQGYYTVRVKHVSESNCILF